MKYLTLIFLLCSSAWATTVTGTVVDPNANPYAAGTASAVSVAVSGQATTSSGPVGTDATGTFTLTLAPNLTYIFTICAAPTNLGPTSNPTPRQICFSSNPIVISGTSQDVGAALSAVAAVLGPRITGSTPVTLQHNGVNNSSQSVFNLTGSGGTIVSDGGGGTISISTSAGGGNVTTTPGAGVNQFIVQQLATAFGTNNLANTRWVTPSWNWIQSPAGTLSPGSNTITLTPCPLGIDTANFTAALYTVYISAVGTAEVAPVTGGTCTSGSATGTIIVTTVNSHGAGYTVGSQSSGIQEAINDACRGTNYGVGAGGVCEVNLEPAGLFATPNYTIQSQLYIHGRAVPSVHFHGHSAEITCAGDRAACIMLGNYNGSGSAGIITDVNIANGNSYGGFNVLDVTASSGTYTVHTSSAHNFSMTANQGGPDYVYTQWYAGSHSAEGIFKLTSVPDNTHFTYVNGNATFANATGWGVAGLENALIEDNLDGSIINNVHQLFGAGPGTPLFAIVGDNDQHMIINNFTDAPQGALCTANICGAAIFQRGDQGNAGIPVIVNSEISLGCLGNGIRAIGGNGLIVDNTVVQGYSQYGIYTSNSLVTSSLKDVYQESTGACTNPMAPAGAQNNEAGLISSFFFTHVAGAFPLSGTFPTFVTGGSTQINYFVVWISGGNKSVPLPIGTAVPTNGGVSIPVSWPALASGAAQSYDLIATTGTTIIPLVGTQTVAVATAQSCTPNPQGWCTFTDTQAARSSYTFAVPAYAPPLVYWPGSVVLNSSTLQTDDAPYGIISNRGNAVSVIAASCQASGSIGTMVSPTLYSCLASDPNNGTGAQATFLQQSDNANNSFFERKGRLNFGSYGNLQGNPPFSTHIITLVDTNITKTTSTPGNRPTNDATDTFIGVDRADFGPTNAGLSMGAPCCVSRYIGNVGDGTSWIERLTSGLESYTVPITTTGGYQQNGTALGENCGITSSCGNTATPLSRFVFGSAPLVSGTPSTVSITGISPAFTSSTSYLCIVTNATTQANPLKVANVSGSSFTITGPNTVTDTANYICIGT